jgi:hypothetical protein
MTERFYESDEPQCPKKCVVQTGTSRIPKICICELSDGHVGDCERVPTMRWAAAGDMTRLPVHKNFIE